MTIAAVLTLALAVIGAMGARGLHAADTKLSVVRGVSAVSVKVGGLGYSAHYPGADVGARARFERANATGRVRGRTIDYVGLRDDQGVAAGNEQAGAQLVQQDEVFAIVPVVTPDLAAVDFLVEEEVPYFGWALSSNFCGNRYGFGFTGCLFPPGGRTTSNAWGVLAKQALGQQVAAPSAAVLTETSPSGEFVLDALTAALESTGFTVVSAASSLPIPAVGDYGGLASGVLTANAGQPPDAVFVVGSYSNVVLTKRALQDGGFTGLFTNTIEYDPARTTLAIGSAVMIQTAPLESAPSNPALQQLVADVRAIAPGQPIDQSVVAGYWAADMFVAALQRAGKNLTVERFLKAANHRFTYRVADTVGPTRFPAAHNRPTPCGALVRSDGAAFVPLVPYTCGKVVRVSE